MIDTAVEVRTEYLVAHEEELKPEQILSSLKKIKKHLRDTGYRQDEEWTVSSSLTKVLDWVGDSSIRATGEIANARQTLKAFTETYELFFVDLSDRLLIEKDSPEFKVSWAQFNQQLTADYLAAFASDDRTFKQSIETFQEVVKFMAQDGDPVFTYVEEMVNGARVQAGLMNYFTEKGCLVLAPDAQDEAEVLEWDVKSGVDFLVLTPNGTVIFIDAKSGTNVNRDASGISANIHQNEECITRDQRLSRSDWDLYHNRFKYVMRDLPREIKAGYEGNIANLAHLMSEQNYRLEHAKIYVNPTCVEGSNGELTAGVKSKLKGRWL